MKRTREDILWDIEYNTKMAKLHTNRAEEAKQELKEYDEANNEN